MRYCRVPVGSQVWPDHLGGQVYGHSPIPAAVRDLISKFLIEDIGEKTVVMSTEVYIPRGIYISPTLRAPNASDGMCSNVLCCVKVLDFFGNHIKISELEWLWWNVLSSVHSIYIPISSIL